MKEIGILFGASDMMTILSGEIVREDSLCVMGTAFGYVVVRYEEAQVSATGAMTVSADRIALEDFWKLEHTGILPEELAEPIKDPNLVEEEFKNTVRQDSLGRYSTVLNLDQTKVGKLADNSSLARKQWVSLVCRLGADAELGKRYEEEVRGFIEAGYAERFPRGKKTQYFLPHFPVVNMTRTTTKVRPVFNASSHAKGELSLNDCILDSPNLLPTAMDTLIKFRLHTVVLTGDIAKAYLQVEIQEEFRNFLCFYWKDDWRIDADPDIYRMTVNTFGMKDAQFNTISVILHHAEKFIDPEPAAENALIKDLYMDDLMAGAINVEAALDLRKGVLSILEKAGMAIGSDASTKH